MFIVQLDSKHPVDCSARIDSGVKIAWLDSSHTSAGLLMLLQKEVISIPKHLSSCEKKKQPFKIKAG